MLTTAFLGVAHIHTPNFIKRLAEMPDVRVKYVYDHDEERGRKAAAQTNSAFAADVAAILADPEVGSVLICSETTRHLPLVLQSASAGKHMFVEKPIAADADEAERMAEAVTNAGVVFQTGFFMRGSPQAQFMRREVEAGNLGKITRMRHTTCHQGSLAGWFDGDYRWIADSAEAGGGGFADLGAHSLDLLLWIMCCSCGPVTNVSSCLGSATARYGAIDEYGVGLVAFESGAVGVLEASWVDPKLRSPIEIHGTRGEILVVDGEVRYYSELLEGADGGVWTDLPPAKPHAFDLFFEALRGNEAALVSIEEAAEEARIMDVLYRSSIA